MQLRTQHDDAGHVDETPSEPKMINNYSLSTFTLENGSVLKGEVADALIQAERDVKEAEDNLAMERMVSPEHVRLEKLKGFELALKDAEGYFRGLRAALTLGQTL